MSRIKNITSVFTIAIFVAMLALPLLNAAECNMDCCVEETTTHCGMEMETDSCCPIVTECKEAVFIPIVSAPILKVNVEKDLTAEYLTSDEILLKCNIEYSDLPQYLKLDITAPPGFQTPLLV